MKNKTCKKCGVEKPIDNFYTHKGMSDGHLNICKECVNERMANYRQDNLVRIRKYDRNRPNQKERLKRQREKIKQNPEKYKKYLGAQKESREKYKYKRNARTKVQRALQAGLLIKSPCCEICGKINCKIHGHHQDYSKPLDVIWVCTECHGKLHRQYDKLELIG